MYIFVFVLFSHYPHLLIFFSFSQRSYCTKFSMKALILIQSANLLSGKNIMKVRRFYGYFYHMMYVAKNY